MPTTIGWKRVGRALLTALVILSYLGAMGCDDGNDNGYNNDYNNGYNNVNDTNYYNHPPPPPPIVTQNPVPNPPPDNGQNNTQPQPQTSPSPPPGPQHPDGQYVLYPGSYDNQTFQNSTISFSRTTGSDTSKAAVYVIRGLTLNNCTLTLDSGQTLLYMDGDMSCQSSTIVVPQSGAPAGPDARNLLILGTSACTTMTLTSCPQFSAAIYAPNAAVSLNGSKIFGGTVGKTLAAKNSTVVYDPHLKGVTLPGVGVVTARSVDEHKI